MYFIATIVITLISAFFLSKLFSKDEQTKNLPGGSLGFFLVGETLSFVRALEKNQGPEWLEERISKHGQVFKTSLMGSPTVVITGQAGNKFVLGAPEGGDLAFKQPITVRAIAGKQTLAELTGSRYKLVKGAMLNFLKPENLQNYIKRMDELVNNILSREIEELKGHPLNVMTTLKKITFNTPCDLIFGIDNEYTRKVLFDEFSMAFKAIWSIPINFPGTVYWKGLRARSRINDQILPILRKRKQELLEGKLKPTNDVLCSMLALRDENHQPLDDGIILDNYVSLLMASYETSAMLMDGIIWKLSRDPEVYKKVLEEHTDIVRERKGRREDLTWGEIQKMKYTWRVAQELMRLIPPAFGGFRKTINDTSYGGYDIPKGWQVFWVAYGTHMSKDVFTNPTEFDPSRFETLSKQIPPYAYVPFGGGRHTCIGNEFVRVETLVTIHNLVTLYEWSLVNPEEVITLPPTSYPSMGLQIKIKPRKSIN